MNSHDQHPLTVTPLHGPRLILAFAGIVTFCGLCLAGTYWLITVLINLIGSAVIGG